MIPKRTRVWQHTVQLKKKSFNFMGYFINCFSSNPYFSFTQISDWTARIAKNNSTLVSRIQIGKTFENRPIFLLQVWKPFQENKQRTDEIVLKNSLTHTPKFTTHIWGRIQTIVWLVLKLAGYSESLVSCIQKSQQQKSQSHIVLI